MSAQRDLPQQQSRATEARLLELRAEAATFGKVQAVGTRIPGAPFPVASPETGYYGVPLLKQPQWSWEIPLYFFVGGAAASAAVIAAVANWTGDDERLRRDGRLVAAAGSAISSVLLISDLGKHERFLNMLRVFKPQSPMSMGAWVLAVFGSMSGAVATAELLEQRFGWRIMRVLGNVVEPLSVAAALPFSNYTGVLIGATVVPVWNHNVRSLPVHFGMSGLNSGVGVLELAGHAGSTPLNTLGIGAAAWETWEGIEVELFRDPVVNEPLRHGVSGWVTRAGGLFSGPVPLGLRLASLFAPRPVARKLRKIAAVSSIVGSLCTRYGWMAAGKSSAKDWRLPLQRKKAPRKINRQQSIEQFPRKEGIVDDRERHAV